MIHALAIALSSLALTADQAPVKWPPLPKEGKHVDYIKWYDNIRRAGMKPEDDAFPIYKEIFPTLKDPDAKPPEQFTFSGPRIDQKPSVLGPWDPKDHPDWEASFQRTQDAIRKFKLASEKPYYFQPNAFTDDADKNGPRLMYLRDPMRAQLRLYSKAVSDVAWRAPEGKVDRKLFLESIRARLGAVRQLERIPMLLDQLVGMAIRANIYEDIQFALYYSVFDSPQLDELNSVLKGDVPLANAAFSFPGECAISFDFFQYSIEHPGIRSDPVLKVFDAMFQQSGLTLEQVSLDLEKYFKLLAQAFAGAGLPTDAPRKKKLDSAQKFRETHPVLRGFAPDLTRANGLRLRVGSSRAATRLLLAMHTYKLQHKKWPATLDDLPEELVDAYRQDPLSNKPFVYRLVKGEPLLYSVSSNGVDDGGVHDRRYGETNPDTDYVYWPPHDLSGLFNNLSKPLPAPTRKKKAKLSQN